MKHLQALAFSYPVTNWLHDHRFMGRTVFPAVESMRVLAAAWVETAGPGKAPLFRNARFPHLLAVPQEVARLDFQIQVEAGGVGAKLTLFWRKPLKNMSRLIRVAEMELAGAEKQADVTAPAVLAQENARRIPAERLYRELVPFGPAFHSLEGEVVLSGATAWGKIRVLPAADLSGAEALGAPLPLDGAMHAACVHGQARADFVPFPVAFQERRIVRPVQYGAAVSVCACLKGQGADAFLYDLFLWQKGELAEVVRGLEMRDVSGGRIRPPAWLASSAGERG